MYENLCKPFNVEKNIKIYSGTGNPALAKRIAETLHLELQGLKLKKFANGETYARFGESVRGDEVFLIQSIAGFNINDLLMELLVAADAATRASVGTLTAVIPHYAYARQDRKSDSREPITARLVANLLETAGFDRIITLDLHADQIQGFFDIPVDALYASSLFIDHIKKMQIEDLLIAAPDLGASKRASAYAKRLGCDLAICHKHRPRANVVDSMTLIGDVKDKNVIIIDDIIDTAGTIVKAGQLIMDNGAKSVRAFATHAVCSGPAMERLDNSVFSEVVVTDSIPLPANASKKIHVVSTADLFADVIHRVESYESISSLFK
jgi:ribose-phosphate pyrophosphokinase